MIETYEAEGNVMMGGERSEGTEEEEGDVGRD